MPSKSNDSLPFDLSSIVVSGPDAASFLQSQLTADLDGLERGEWTPAAWCNPKGRALAVVRVQPDGDVFHLALPAPIAEGVMKRLDLYRIGRNVTISAGHDLAPDEGGELRRANTPVSKERMHRWFVEEIDRGMPWILTDTADRFLPQMLGLERIGGLSYRKGCYPGQEIVARVHYRGRVTRQLARFESDAEAPAPGTSFALDVGECTVLYAVESIDPAVGSIGLMVVPADIAPRGSETGISEGIRIHWVVVDADHAVLPSGA